MYVEPHGGISTRRAQIFFRIDGVDGEKWAFAGEPDR
jgi:hypothetical protein